MCVPASKQPPAGSLPPDETHRLTVGLGIAQLLVNSHEWVWRRTETFSFTGASTVRRQVAIDFELPRHAIDGMDMDCDAVRAMIESAARHDAAVHVPLLTLHKEKLTNVDVFDEDRRTLPLLTTEQNGAIAGQALLGTALGVASSVAGSDPITTIPRSIANALSAVAELPSREARVLLSCLTDGVDEHVPEAQAYRLAAEAGGRDAELAGVVRGHLDALERLSEPERQVGATLLLDDLLGGLARKLAGDFVVLVPLTGEPHERRVLKFAYEEPLAKPEGRSSTSRSRRAWWWVAERCSWRPKEFAFSRILVGTTASYHVELVAPENTDIVRGVFEAHVPPPGANNPSPARATGPDARDAVSGSNPRRGHMQLRQLPAQAYATARVQLCPSRSGLVNAAMLVTWLVVAVFFAGLGRVDHIDQADVAAATLLAVPSVLAAYIARPGEHELVSMMLSGVRAMVAASGMLSFVVAAALAFGYEADGQLDDIWRLLRWPALLLALGVTWSWFVMHQPAAPRTFRSWVANALACDPDVP